ncbi:hypothetical protein [Falsigemmobacter faecalis]|uniref:Uncharacterized protein n=1 Tax=Falsigemmobacter faecalis TaxID=2488730 RepID=A0A3P3DPV4_9RHOB|nr:hypothetical protein [Falsigemmobacter faecalis]RRH76215.1 hypothetical protein EG244_07340 [Falsigemmobacter faecalis]
MKSCAACRGSLWDLQMIRHEMAEPGAAKLSVCHAVRRKARNEGTRPETSLIRAGLPQLMTRGIDGGRRLYPPHRDEAALARQAAPSPGGGARAGMSDKIAKLL